MDADVDMIISPASLNSFPLIMSWPWWPPGLCVHVTVAIVAMSDDLVRHGRTPPHRDSTRDGRHTFSFLEPGAPALQTGPRLTPEPVAGAPVTNITSTSTTQGLEPDRAWRGQHSCSCYCPPLGTADVEVNGNLRASQATRVARAIPRIRSL